MNTNIQALQELYVKLGGSLTDTYENIADGAPVSDYTIIPDMIAAVTQVAGSGGGGGGNPVTPIMLINNLRFKKIGGGPETVIFLDIRRDEQCVPGGMADLDDDAIVAQINNLANGTGTDNQKKNALFLKSVFFTPQNYGGFCPHPEVLRDIANVEEATVYELWSSISELINNSPEATLLGNWTGNPKVEAGKYISEQLDGFAPRIAAVADRLDISDSEIETATEALGICPLATSYQRQMTVSFYDRDGKEVWLFCNPVIYKTQEMQSFQRIAEVTFQHKGVSYTFRSPEYEYDNPGVNVVTWEKVTE